MAKRGKMKTSTKVLLGAGGVAALGGLAYALLRKPKTEDDSMKTDSTRTSSTSRAAIKSKKSAQGAAAASTAIATKYIEPKGWLGALVAHGGACMSFEIEYMTGSEYGKHYHLSPIVMAHWKKGSGDIEINMDDNGLLTNRYKEFPCPVYPQTTPLFLQSSAIEAVGKHNGGTTDLWKQAARASAGANEPGFLIEWGLTSELDHAESGPDTSWGIRVGEGGYLEHRPNFNDPGVHWERVYPAKRVGQWAMHQSIHGANNIGRDNRLAATLPLLSTLVPGSMSRAVIVPPFWRKNSQRLHDWYVRLLRWYYTARWLVWSGEMLRIHAGVALPDWWRTHATLWAIGTPGTARNKRPSYDMAKLNTPKIPYGGSKVILDSSLRVSMSPNAVNQVLKTIIRHTWPPGTAGATGEQIYPEGSARTLCDIPIEAGSVAPPIELLDEEDRQVWAIFAVSKFKQHEEFMPWEKWFKLGNSIVTSAISAGIGGAISAGVSAMSAIAQQLIITTMTYTLQTITQMGMGSLKFNAGDIVGLMGGLLSAAGLETNVVKALPPQLWDSLKTVGGHIPFISGTDWAQVHPQLLLIQQQLETIQVYKKWGYADAAYGGLGLSGSVRDLGVGVFG